MADTRRNSERKDQEFYSYIIYNKNLRFGFFMFQSLTFLLFVFIVMRNLTGGGNWAHVVLPVLLFGMPVMLYPPTEAWIYEPWQALTEKYERHFVESEFDIDDEDFL